MDPRQLLAQSLSQLHAIAPQVRIAHQAMAGSGAANAPHDEKGPTDNIGIAQPEWLGHLHAGIKGGSEQRELLSPAVTHGNLSRCICSQHACQSAGQRTADNLCIQCPVFLDSATGEQAEASQSDTFGTGPCGNKMFDSVGEGCLGHTCLTKN
ncbi:hypothetical protein D3C76_969800 [compost metagenome]